MALERKKAKLSGTYKKPKTAKELAKERIAAKKAGTYKKPKTAQELATERIAKRKKQNPQVHIVKIGKGKTQLLLGRYLNIGGKHGSYR